MNELHVQFGRVRQKAAWLELKQSELRPDDAISFFAHLQAQEDFAIEISLLSGHALMAQQLAAKKHIKLDPYSQRLLRDIRVYSCRLPFM